MVARHQDHSSSKRKEEEEQKLDHVQYSTIWYFPKIRGPQYRPQNTIVLIMGTPKGIPNFGKPPYGFRKWLSAALDAESSLRWWLRLRQVPLLGERVHVPQVVTSQGLIKGNIGVIKGLYGGHKGTLPRSWQIKGKRTWSMSWKLLRDFVSPGG